MSIVAPYAASITERQPYLTVAEFTAAPTGVEVDDLVPGGSAQDQTAALAVIINQASAYADSLVYGADGAIGATVNTETGRVRIDRDGWVHITPRFYPVLAVEQVLIGTTPADLAAADLSGCWIERQGIHLTAGGLGTAVTVGPLQFGGYTPAGGRLLAQWSYVNGWPCTTLAAAAAVGATSITVTAATGIYTVAGAGPVLRIADGTDAENVTVTGTAGNVLTLAAPLTYSHAAGIGVAAPNLDTVKEAVVRLTCYLIKTRGTEAIVMATVEAEPSHTVPGSGGAEEDFAVAVDLLESFRTEVA